MQRYDGTRFITYLADIHNPEALHTDWISAIFEDSKHRLWIGTAHEAPYLLNRSNGNFYNYNLHVTPDHKKINGVTKFLEDKNGDIWIVAGDGYYKLNSSNNQFESLNNKLGINNKTLASWIAIDKPGNLWFATTNGVKELEYKTENLFDKNNNPKHQTVFDIPKTGGDIVFDDDNNLWISSAYEGYLYRFNLLHNMVETYSFKKPLAKRLDSSTQLEILGKVFKTSKGEVIVPLLSRGIAVYDPYKNNFSITEPSNETPYGFHLTEFSSMALTEDREKNIWIATDAGLNIFNSSYQHFFSYGLSIDTVSKVFPSIPVSDFLQTTNGDIYVSYYFVNGGIVQLDSKLNFKHHYLYKENSNFNSPINQLWNLFIDDSGTIWSPNQQGSILKLNTASGQLSIFKDSTLKGNINQIQGDAEHNTWIAHWNKGLIEINKRTGVITPFTKFFQPQAPGSYRINCLLQDDDKMWVGTMGNGLQVFDKTKKQFVESFTTDESNPRSVSSNNIIGILSYNKDTLVLATELGINIFDKTKKTFKLISAKEGLRSNLIQAIIMDDYNNLWVAFVGGFCKINMQNFIITGYDMNDGIIDFGFNNRFLKLHDGNIMIGGGKSFTVFNPATIAESKPPPNVVITGLSVFGKELQPDSLLQKNQPLNLPYNNNNIHIEFSSLQFSSPDKIKYYYKLEGVDKDWIVSGKENAVNYNQLNNGEYIFKIKCANRDGVFCKDVTTLTIHIAPPFWKTWWFITLFLIALIFLIYLFIRRRETKLKAENAQKVRIEQLTAAQYRNRLEMEKIINYFSFSLADKTTIDDVLWDVAKNLIGKLEFIDCIIYLWNADKTKLIQRAGYGEKGSLEKIQNQYFDVSPGQGVVGFVCQTKQPLLITDTSKDSRYRVDDKRRFSELTVPIIYNDELIGVIDTEHDEKNFFTERHLQLLTTIAGMMATKINVIESERSLRLQKAELANINQQLSEIQLAALRSQMNPHFIFNALNSIKTFVMENDSENAEKYLDKFAKLIRFILDTTQTGTVLLQKEIDLLTLYLDLEQLRFSDKLSYKISVDDNIDAENILIPSMLIQPYVENAILHGILHKEDRGFVQVTFKLFTTWLQIIIEDDGVGREKAKEYKKNSVHHSLSMEITNKRLQSLQKDNAHAGVTVLDMKDELNKATGTRVIIEVPL